MFYRYIAAIFLLPASFLVYAFPGAWLRAMRQSPRSFFSVVVKSAPALVTRNHSRLWKLCVVYPTRIGVSLTRDKSLRVTAGYMLSALKKKLFDRTQAHQWRPAPGSQPPLPLLSLERLREMIRRPEIRVVSFDVFDTLLVRPALHPKDIFHLVARKVDAVHGVDFIKLRWDAEARLKNPHATIHDIYAFIQREHQLSPEVTAALMAEEIHCEETLLAPRRIMAELHAEAVRLGKRVIAVSDMYLPGDVLKGILHSKGLDMAAVYVSCEYRARKSDGALYDAVLAAEGVHPSEMLHFGDNVASDYTQALKKNITAVYYPSVFDMAFGDGTVYESVFAKGVRNDPLWSLLLGSGLNQLYDGPEPPEDILHARDLRHFSLLTMAPLLTGFCLQLANSDIQKTYARIYFAARDGYLPHKIYELVGRYVSCCPGVYFYAGRRAYYPWLYDSFWEYAKSLRNAANPDAYTLLDFVRTYFRGDAVLERLEAELPDTEKEMLFFRSKQECLNVLRRFQEDIDACMADKRAAIKDYYTKTFADGEERHLIFDVGYSGSIGKAVSIITGKPADKIYFWAEPENRKADQALGTTTRVFMKNPGYAWANILHEELLSPCEGGTIGFEDGRPVLEEVDLSPALEQDLACVQKTCLDFAETFCRTFGDYAPFMTLQHPDASVEICKALLERAPAVNMPLFRNITFPDPVYQAVPLSLEKKMEPFFPQRTVFTGTGFEHPDARLLPTPCLKDGYGRIGIHLHLYHTGIYQEFLRYMQDFPVPFDLYITTPNPDFLRTAQTLFTQATMPRVQNVTVLSVPNRGRDVAPWVLSMRPYQDRYDLFCHVHTKESAHIGFGNPWRRYLFDNLLRADSVTAILNEFAVQPQMGCLFPAIHDGLRLVMTHVETQLYGSEHEYALITDMFGRMGFVEELRRSELFFSVGTMLWYRPHALRQLFTCALTLDEFPEEPVDVGGTLAHAMERVPALLARRNGYLARSLTRYESVRAMPEQ